jgi:hypothetical protein
MPTSRGQRTAASDDDLTKVQRFIEDNLRSRIKTLEKEVERLKRDEWVLWDLWSREVPPGWRMWRVKRRRTAAEKLIEERTRTTLREGS